MDKDYLISEKVLQALLVYLYKKPMQEVEQLVTAIRQSKPVIEQKDLEVIENDFVEEPKEEA